MNNKDPSKSFKEGVYLSKEVHYKDGVGPVPSDGVINVPDNIDGVPLSDIDTVFYRYYLKNVFRSAPYKYGDRDPPPSYADVMKDAAQAATQAIRSNRIRVARRNRLPPPPPPNGGPPPPPPRRYYDPPPPPPARRPLPPNRPPLPPNRPPPQRPRRTRRNTRRNNRRNNRRNSRKH